MCNSKISSPTNRGNKSGTERHRAYHGDGAYLRCWSGVWTIFAPILKSFMVKKGIIMNELTFLVQEN